MAPAPDNKKLSVLLQLESQARHCENRERLAFHIVNETRRLLEYQQALLLIAKPGSGNPRFELDSASSLAQVERDAPFTQWIEAQVAKRSWDEGVQVIEADSLDERERADWLEFGQDQVMVSPLAIGDGPILGLLWCSRERTWSERGNVLARRLSETYAHAWQALDVQRRWRPLRSVGGRTRFAIAAFLLCFCALPIRITALAPTEVIARDPFAVTAPLDGVVQRIEVAPNQIVEAGAVLFVFEDTELRNRLAVAERALAVAEAALRTATQGAFRSADRNAQVALLQSKVDLAKAERDWASEALERVVVRAPHAGVALFDDAWEWEGRPVAVGERIMQLADPASMEVRIDLAVADSIVLATEAPVSIFLDAAPLSSYDAHTTRASHNAQPTPSGVLAFRLHASFDETPEDLRIGLQGTAKVYGERVALGFYLFRRPLAALRQWVGA